MFRPLLLTTAIVGALTGFGAAAFAQSDESPMVYPHHAFRHGALPHGGLPPVSGTLHLHPGAAVYDVGQGYGENEAYPGRRYGHHHARVVYGTDRPLLGRYGEAPLLPATGHHHAYGAYGAFGTDVAFGTGATSYGEGGYGIPPAGGLAVYSPGAYGPGPRIIHIPSGWGATSQQWGCGCARHAED